jgi:Ca-activated chloride channel family protein
VQLQRGNQAYRQGDVKKAAQEYAGVDSATAHYNRGNALAKAGEYPQAIGAYDEALRREPGMADALANKRAVEAAMKRQQQGGGKGAGQKSQGGQSNPQSSPSQSNQAANSNPQTQSSSSAPQKQQANPPQQQSQRSQAQASPAKPQDAQAQQEADRAQRERMQRALQQAKQRQGQPSQEGQARRNETPEQRERRLANEAWLRRVPDDPGGLLRAKFRLEYERRVSQDRTEE